MAFRTMIKVLNCLHGATRETVCERANVSRATFTRQMQVLRSVGVEIERVRRFCETTYHVKDYGPFDPTKLRRALNARI
jgi:hypothetical protein